MPVFWVSSVILPSVLLTEWASALGYVSSGSLFAFTMVGLGFSAWSTLLHAQLVLKQRAAVLLVGTRVPHSRPFLYSPLLYFPLSFFWGGEQPPRPLPYLS